MFLTVCLLAGATTAFAKAQYTTPPPAGAQTALVIESGPPDPKYAGPGIAMVPNTNFLIFQAKGGSILLGPIFGAMNVEAKSKKLAQGAVGGYLGVDLPAIAAKSLAAAGADAQPKAGGYTVKPFGFVQQCGDDEMYRVAIAYDVKAPGGKDAWHGRYMAYLADPIPYAHFHAPTDALVAAFVADLTAAADEATVLMQRDMRGELPETGREVKFGSFNLVCNKLGGMGIYTPASELFVTKVRLIEERDGMVVIRMRSPPTMMFYGLHTMARAKVHKLE
jgi:hypothetical protein